MVIWSTSLFSAKLISSAILVVLRAEVLSRGFPPPLTAVPRGAWYLVLFQTMLRLLKVLYFVLCLIGLIPGSEPAEPASVKILVLGRTGSGKSTLINNILGRKIASVGHRPFPETSTVSVYKEEIHGVSVTVCDTPGLGDASGNEEDYMRKIKTSCDNPDLVLYCLSMDNTRWQTDDEEALKTVTKHLGNKIWEHSVLVLTLADRFVANYNLKNEVVKAFEQRISDLELLFKGALEKIGLQVKPKGNIYSAVSANDSRHLPGVSDWMGSLMTTCLAASHENGIEGFRQIMLGRLTNRHPEDEVPLVWTDIICNVLKK